MAPTCASPSSSLCQPCWTIVTFAYFVPCSGCWLVSGAPLSLHLIHPFLRFLSPNFRCPLDFPLHSLSIFMPSSTNISTAPCLSAGFFQIRFDQKRKFVIRFESASHLTDCVTVLQSATTYGDLWNFPTLDLEHDCHGLRALLPTVAQEQRQNDCSLLREYSEQAPVVNSGPLPPSTIELNAAAVCDLNTQRVAPRLKMRRKICNSSTSKFFPVTRCPTAPTATMSSSLYSAPRYSQNQNDVLRWQMRDKDPGTCQVEDRQQSSCGDVVDGRVSEEVVVSIPTISPVNNGLNWSQNPSFKSSECDLDIRTTADMFNMHASEDSEFGDLPDELLGCLLDPSFRSLVESVEGILGDINNPANIDLITVADFLALRP
ncbi:uncharacterized protein [Physcomitrium patens]|uniref:uncharacterized protein isoform X1 n=1 Tax=Physcomitrium patens TaxID=3218 RepID=UPI000D16A3F4|nr:uncharacterized protein LOC112275032 isoform X1 [Physcomitrium patens]|eukprot:XP_024360730.1 uncharacterized protein LOC112275032 isoform X1 [Physcomitrella patens]